MINTGERGGGGGAIAAIALLVIVAVGRRSSIFGGYLQRAADKIDINVNVDAPKVELPDVKIDSGKNDAPATNSGK